MIILLVLWVLWSLGWIACWGWVAATGGVFVGTLLAVISFGVMLWLPCQIYEDTKKVDDAIESSVKPTRSRRITNDVMAEVMRRDAGACVNCGATSDIQFGHIIPFSHGGSNSADNIQLECQQCNLRKGARLSERGR